MIKPTTTHSLPAGAVSTSHTDTEDHDFTELHRQLAEPRPPYVRPKVRLWHRLDMPQTIVLTLCMAVVFSACLGVGLWQNRQVVHLAHGFTHLIPHHHGQPTPDTRVIIHRRTIHGRTVLITSKPSTLTRTRTQTRTVTRTRTRTQAPQPRVTVTVTRAPAPAPTVTVTEPAPTVTVTVTAPAPDPTGTG